MEKRYTVFVSSTFKDLAEERAEVMQALLELDCIPAGMELFPASNDSQWELIRRVIDDCDYYIVIIGGRYGSLSADGLSYTEREYDYAVSKDMPVLGFVHKNLGKLPAEKVELDKGAQEKLGRFREKVLGRLVKEWTTADDLGGKVSRSLAQAIKTHPQIGWIRADQASSSELLEEVNSLRKEVEKLRASEASASIAPPDNAQEFAGGEDKYQICGLFSDYDETYQDIEWSANVSWNKIFSILAPSFENPISTDQAKSEMTILFGLSEQRKKYEDVRNIKLYEQVGDQILQQFRALGFIEKLKDGKWKLTAYGDKSFFDLLAIRRQKPITK